MAGRKHHYQESYFRQEALEIRWMRVNYICVLCTRNWAVSVGSEFHLGVFDYTRELFIVLFAWFFVRDFRFCCCVSLGIKFVSKYHEREIKYRLLGDPLVVNFKMDYFYVCFAKFGATNWVYRMENFLATCFLFFLSSKLVNYGRF